MTENRTIKAFLDFCTRHICGNRNETIEAISVMKTMAQENRRKGFVQEAEFIEASSKYLESTLGI